MAQGPLFTQALQLACHRHFLASDTEPLATGCVSELKSNPYPVNKQRDKAPSRTPHKFISPAPASSLEVLGRFHERCGTINPKPCQALKRRPHVAPWRFQDSELWPVLLGTLLALLDSTWSSDRDWVMLVGDRQAKPLVHFQQLILEGSWLTFWALTHMNQKDHVDQSRQTPP